MNQNTVNNALLDAMLMQDFRLFSNKLCVDNQNFSVLDELGKLDKHAQRMIFRNTAQSLHTKQFGQHLAGRRLASGETHS